MFPRNVLILMMMGFQTTLTATTPTPTFTQAPPNSATVKTINALATLASARLTKAANPPATFTLKILMMVK